VLLLVEALLVEALLVEALLVEALLVEALLVEALLVEALLVEALLVEAPPSSGVFSHGSPFCTDQVRIRFWNVTQAVTDRAKKARPTAQLQGL